MISIHGTLPKVILVFFYIIKVKFILFAFFIKNLLTFFYLILYTIL